MAVALWGRRKKKVEAPKPCSCCLWDGKQVYAAKHEVVLSLDLAGYMGRRSIRAVLHLCEVCDLIYKSDPSFRGDVRAAVLLRAVSGGGNWGAAE